MSYIYKITNKINNKSYIGKTAHTVHKRFAEHIADSKRPSKQMRPLYYAFNKYGIENFTLEELEFCENDDIASQREQYWIDFYDTYRNGYNATYGGDGKRLYDYTQLANAYLELKNVQKVCEKYSCDEQTVRNACMEKNITILGQVQQRKKIKRIITKTGEEKIYDSVTLAGYDIIGKEPETARKNIARALNRSKSHKAYDSTWWFI